MDSPVRPPVDYQLQIKILDRWGDHSFASLKRGEDGRYRGRTLNLLIAVALLALLTSIYNMLKHLSFRTTYPELAQVLSSLCDSES